MLKRPPPATCTHIAILEDVSEVHLDLTVAVCVGRCRERWCTHRSVLNTGARALLTDCLPAGGASLSAASLAPLCDTKRDGGDGWVGHAWPPAPCDAAPPDPASRLPVTVG